MCWGLQGCWVGGLGTHQLLLRPCRSGWGFWESELQLTWSKCSQKGPAGCGGAKREVRGRIMVVGPLCMWSQLPAMTRFLPAVLSLRCSQAFSGRWQDQGPSLDFFQQQQKNHFHSWPHLCPSVWGSDQVTIQTDWQAPAWGGWVSQQENVTSPPSAKATLALLKVSLKKSIW